VQNHCLSPKKRIARRIYAKTVEITHYPLRLTRKSYIETGLRTKFLSPKQWFLLSSILDASDAKLESIILESLAHSSLSEVALVSEEIAHARLICIAPGKVDENQNDLEYAIATLRDIPQSFLKIQAIIAFVAANA
jgi:hypothetical protein